jgi:membrane fusion protein (multidrug efflux system)
MGVLLMLLALAGCDSNQSPTAAMPGAGPRTVEVAVMTMTPEAVTRDTELPGRVVALATAEIRPQIDGIVRKIVYREGGQVAEGEALYELDDRKFRAAQDAAAAALKKSEATVTSASAAYQRAEKLIASKAVSDQDLDDARSTLLQAQADAESARADLETAKINLDNATIRAPIGGMIGTSGVSVGSLVTANQTDALATIRQIDPVYVDLVDSSANLLRIRDELRSGVLSRDKGNPPKVKLILENGETYDQQGTISLADIVVSESTGTFSLRAKFPNPDHVLLPGMFVRTSVELGTMNKTFLVPQRAVTRDDAGDAIAYFVSDDNKVEQRTITTVGNSGQSWIVTAGVSPGDRLIVDGFQKISPGAAVTTVAAKIDDNGVVEQTLAGDAAAKPETTAK